MNVEMRSKYYEIMEILKPTKAKWWGDLKVGDIIQFRMEITGKYISCGHRESTYFQCVKLNSDDEPYQYTDNQILKYMKKFVVESRIVKLTTSL